jgi:uncharacterized protein (DUF302 family)
LKHRAPRACVAKATPKREAEPAQNQRAAPSCGQPLCRLLKETCMKRLATLSAIVCLCTATAAAAADGLVALKSPHPAKDTMNRFEENAKQRGLTVFARIDHAAGAAKVGKTLRPTEVLIFGNPQGGTPLMECAQSAGIDLPLKALVWEDAQGQVWLGYNDPAWLASRHGAAQCPAAEAIGKALASLSETTLAR